MKILLVEDDLEISKLLAEFLQENGYEVFCQYDGLHVLDCLRENKIDLILLDIMLPYRNGDTVLSAVRECSTVPIIVISAKGTTQNKVDLLRLGADDYITKPFNILEVKARMKAILRRNSSMEKKAPKSNVITAGDMKIDCDSRNLYIAGKEINLTAKEFDLLEMLAVNPGKVYSRDNLLKAVWGQDYSGDGRTVDVHMRRLREKIEDNPSEPKYVHTKWGVGYYFNV